MTQLLMCIYIYGYMFFGFWNRAVAIKKKESAFKMKNKNKTKTKQSHVTHPCKEAENLSGVWNTKLMQTNPWLLLFGQLEGNVISKWITLSYITHLTSLLINCLLCNTVKTIGMLENCFFFLLLFVNWVWFIRQRKIF